MTELRDIPVFVYPPSAIHYGYTFDTCFEQGCVAASEVDPDTGTFYGRDSDGVLCSYLLVMVEAVWDEEGFPVQL